MNKLFEIDLKDYDEGLEKIYRPSSRAIILKDDKIALVYSLRDKYYKFPGGGIENGEDKINALTREVLEEVGLKVIPSSIKEFGSVLRKQKTEDNKIFIQENFYYFCDCEEDILNQNLDDYERDALFVLRFQSLDEAIKVNEEFHSNNLFDEIMIRREEKVLKLIRGHLSVI